MSIHSSSSSPGLRDGVGMNLWNFSAENARESSTCGIKFSGAVSRVSIQSEP